MNKYRFILLCMLMVPSLLHAVPAKNRWKQMLAADGTMLNVKMMGDENGHWFVDEAGNVLLMDANDVLYYASERNVSALKAKSKAKSEASRARRMKRLQNARTKGKRAEGAGFDFGGEPTLYQGKKKGLVILVEFSNRKFSFGTATQSVNELYDKFYNSNGAPQAGYLGSVHDYFYDQSYGQFDLTFDVIGPVQVSKASTYYGKNDLYGDDLHPAEMVIEALQLASEQGVDFSQYDWDGDSEVDQVLCVYAGTGEAASSVSSDIWPHEFNLESANYYGDGTGVQNFGDVYVNTYAVTCELASRNTMDGIGTACHEFSHCLGLPDFYDTEYSGASGMMNWDLMAGGSYSGPNGNGEVPVAYNSHERWMAGWLTPTVLDEPCVVTDMPYLGDEPVAYVIYNDACPSEHYLLENRQLSRWDSYLNTNSSTHGMLILHVDYDEMTWFDNTVNNDKNHQRMCFVPADNSYGTYSRWDGMWTANAKQMAGDPFPGLSGATEFTDKSVPAQKLFNANTDGTFFLHKPITAISDNNGLVSFCFMDGTTGISAASINDEAQDVYSLQGIKMGKRIDKLPKGIYIIGGKKVMIAETHR